MVKKMSIRIRKFIYQAKDGSIREYFYKYGYWREGTKIKCKYLGKVKDGSKNKREAKS